MSQTEISFWFEGAGGFFDKSSDSSVWSSYFAHTIVREKGKQKRCQQMVQKFDGESGANTTMSCGIWRH